MTSQQACAPSDAAVERSEDTESAQTTATIDDADAVKPRVKQRRGFAAMDKEEHRELARSGGVAAHAAGLAHKFSSEKAREAGKKGGRTTSANREHMVEIGRRGGYAKRGFRMDQDASARASKKS